MSNLIQFPGRPSREWRFVSRMGHPGSRVTTTMGWMDTAPRFQMPLVEIPLALECPSCQRTSWATLILGSKAYEPERMPTVRMSEGFTVRLGSTLEIRCGHCDVAVWQHNEPISEL